MHNCIIYLQLKQPLNRAINVKSASMPVDKLQHLLPLTAHTCCLIAVDGHFRTGKCAHNIPPSPCQHMAPLSRTTSYAVFLHRSVLRSGGDLLWPPMSSLFHPPMVPHRKGVGGKVQFNVASTNNHRKRNNLSIAPYIYIWRWPR